MRRWHCIPAVLGALGLLALGAGSVEAQLKPTFVGRVGSTLGATRGPRLAPSAGVQSAPDGAGVARHPGTGLVTFMTVPAGAAAASAEGATGATGATPELAARSFLAANAASFGIADAAADLRLIREDAAGGGSVVRLRQLYRGVPVFGGELHVAVGADRQVRWVSAETIEPQGVSVTPAIDAAAALATAVAATAAKYSIAASSLGAGSPALEVYDEVIFNPERRSPSLVWRCELRSTVRPLRELVLVDAATGAVRLAFNQIDTAGKNRQTYTMGNSSVEADLPGALVCDESDPTCAAGDADEQDAHRYAGDTYDYFLSVLGRHGIDGADMAMISSVHFGPPSSSTDWFANAFWNGTQMVYGDGFSQADDVVGHELAHGVMEYTANLYYWAESGAINESYSDLHGEFVDQRNSAGNDDAAVRWLVGEDLPFVAPAANGAIRNMANPPAFLDPDRVGSKYFYRDLYDNAGVHFNSGVNNKAVYLLTDGGAFNGRVVGSIGAGKVAWLYYVVQRDYLLPASNYNDLAVFLRAACTSLAATADHGFTTADCGQVGKALLAVEMDKQPGQRFVDDGNAKMTFKGAWSAQPDPDVLYSGYHASSAIGDTARVKFSGSRATVYGSFTGPGLGVLDIFLDSTTRKIGSYNQATNGAGAIYLKGIPTGSHTLILRHAKPGVVTVDAVATRSAAVPVPADGQLGYLLGWGYYATTLNYVTPKGSWSMWPGFVSWSATVGDTAAYTFTGNAFTIFYLADDTDSDLGYLQVLLDGRSLGFINQQAVDPIDGAGLYGIGVDGFPRGRHSVTVKHYNGNVVTFEGFGAYDLTKP
jgi:Zn-dependent metalloprotease